MRCPRRFVCGRLLLRLLPEKGLTATAPQAADPAGPAMEHSERNDTVFMDTTGTLTKGEPHVTDHEAVGNDQN